MAMGEWAKAESAYSEALLIDPSIRRSKSFKVLSLFFLNKLILGLKFIYCCYFARV